MATIGDLVLVYKEDVPAFFARIEDIVADRRPDWFRVTLLILQVPVVETVWILREAYINGEGFTMNGIPLRLEKVKGAARPGPHAEVDGDGHARHKDGRKGKVISLLDRKKD
ncbi:MAG: hypothetical protein JRI36_05755 [Deltaproteobacteria bacterium]|nr:hypothetical protein [Deltaproteobacteria bacterium]